MNKTLRKLLIALACIAVVALLIVFYLGIGFQTLPVERSIAGLVNSELYLTAHRGLSAVAPENTAPAIEEAGKAGFYAAEFDITLTKDGVWILNHDSSVDKMSNGEGEVSDYTCEEIMQFTIDNGNGIENYPDLQFTTFEDALAICVEYGMRAMIEIKGGNAEDMQGFLNILKASPAYETALVIDFNSERMAKLRALDSDLELWFLTTTISEDDIAFAKEQGAGLGFNFGNVLFKPHLIKAAREQGLTIASWTIDFPPILDALRVMGVKYITTNKILP